MMIDIWRICYILGCVFGIYYISHLAIVTGLFRTLYGLVDIHLIGLVGCARVFYFVCLYWFL